MAEIKEIHGNIFNTTCQTVVNTVNCYGVMGKGLALEFRHRYPDMYEKYRAVCSEKQLKVGMLQLWKHSAPWILNFPTKNHWRQPSRLDYIERGLKKFASEYRKKGITSVAFPQLGTQSGGLDWTDVKELMYRHLLPLENLSVEIYIFDPLGAV